MSDEEDPACVVDPSVIVELTPKVVPSTALTPVVDSEGLLDPESYRCRYYENDWPEVEDVVAVQIVSKSEDGAVVKLVEYNGLQGFVPLTEVSKSGKVKAVHQLLQIGRFCHAIVLEVNSIKGMSVCVCVCVRSGRESFFQTSCICLTLSWWLSRGDMRTRVCTVCWMRRFHGFVLQTCHSRTSPGM